MRLIDGDSIKWHRTTECGGHGIFFSVDQAYKKEIDAIPTIDPESLRPRWVPVTERLPPRKEPVLICFTDGKMEVGFWYDQDEDLTYWCGCVNDGYLEELDCDPTHWMPLPEPPESEGV